MNGFKLISFCSLNSPRPALGSHYSIRDRCTGHRTLGGFAPRFVGKRVAALLLQFPSLNKFLCAAEYEIYLRVLLLWVFGLGIFCAVKKFLINLPITSK